MPPARKGNFAVSAVVVLANALVYHQSSLRTKRACQETDPDFSDRKRGKGNDIQPIRGPRNSYCRSG